MVCVVHYDLLGLFPLYPYRRYTYKVNKQQPAMMNFNYNMWLPKPGTDTTDYYSYPTILVNDYDDDAYWADVTNANDDDDDADIGSTSSCPSAQSNDEETCSAAARDDFNQTPKTAHADDNRVYIAPADGAPPLSSSFGNFKYEYEDNDDYTAPGEERDDDVF